MKSTRYSVIKVRRKVCQGWPTHGRVTSQNGALSADPMRKEM